MPRPRRREVFEEHTVGIYHCVNRCVRRAFLCGIDAATGKSYAHRKDWLRDRLETLAAIFAIDVIGYALRDGPSGPVLAEQAIRMPWRRGIPTACRRLSFSRPSGHSAHGRWPNWPRVTDPIPRGRPAVWWVAPGGSKAGARCDAGGLRPALLGRPAIDRLRL